MARQVFVVPHTHWDREWYSSFQTFRMKLVDLVDQLLSLLENDPSYAHFQLDGQMAAVDDYLTIRPENAARVRQLNAAGRLSMGPWYALPDEFLVSGETLVRNLQLGIERAAGFGGAMPVGYLPDMFGHVAQMPQILHQFGFDHAVVWRGVPTAVDKDGFWWQAPDGTTVRAEYLPDGYGNGAHLSDDAKDLVARIAQFESEHHGRLTGPVLWLNGTDHLLPQPWLGRVVAEANDVQDDYELHVTSLATYLASASTEGLPRWSGELRSGARANLLMGVASNRVDVKQAAARAERSLEKLAEPLSALLLPAESWPRGFLDEAWTRMARNSAHDSICACSIDEVCDAVNHRYREASRIAEGLTDRALDALASRVSSAGALVVNPSPRPRSGIIELRLPGEGGGDGLQLISQRSTEATLRARVKDCLRMAREALNHVEGFYAYDVDVDDDGSLHIVLHRDQSKRERVSSGELLSAVEALGLAEDAPASLTTRRSPTRIVLARAADVPGYGWERWEPAPLDTPPVSATEVMLSNGLVEVAIAADGTFALGDRPGFGRLVDGGDSGDSYNYNEPAGDELVDTPESTTVTVIEKGPLRGRVAIDAVYRWPVRIVDDKRTGSATVDTHTVLELRSGEPFVRVTVDLDNHVRDHRLRAHFPLPSPATNSSAECAFAVVERGLEAEGGMTERGLPTYPCRRFVQAGGITVVHDGLLEYELVDIRDGAAHELALTLLRCTGMLSQGPMAYRPMPAGPLTPIEGAQMQGPVRVRYAVAWGDVDPYAMADDALVPLLTVDATGEGSEPDRGQALAVEGAEVSAVVRNAGALIVRVFNPSDVETTVRVEGRRGWRIDLAGRPLEPFESSFALRPWGIATVQLTD